MRLSRLRQHVIDPLKEDLRPLMGEPGTNHLGAEDFETYRRLETARYGRLVGLIACLAMPVLYPFDAWTYPDQPQIFLFIRINFAIVNLLAYLLFRFLPPRHSVWAILTFSPIAMGYHFYVMGLQPPTTPPLIFNVLVSCAWTLPALVPFFERIMLTATCCGAAIFGYYFARGAGLTAEENIRVILVYTSTCSMVSILFGHMIYRLEQTNFAQRQQIKADRERALFQARRLEELDRAKDSFLATVSHELRTPLGAIVGLTDVVLDVRLDAVTRQHIHTIQGSGEVLLTLINDILDLSKIRSGKLEMESFTFSPRELIESAANLIAVPCQKKGLELSFFIPPELPMLVGDPGRLGQIITNLTSNAVKFTDHGEIRVICAVEESRLRISVEDTGVGVPSDRREAVFEEFLQADASTSRRFGGTGLGLPIARRLAHAMGGDVTHEPRTGGGSVFSVVLPVASNDFDRPRQLPELQGLHVVVCATHPLRRQHLAEELVAWGLRVDAVERLEDATSSVNGATRLCLVDVPSLTPEQLRSSSLLAADGAQTVPVVVLLNATELAARGTQFRIAGLQTILLQPFYRKQLEELLLPPLLGKQISGSAPELESPEPELPAPERLLVIDDSPVNQMLVETYVSGLPINVTLASDGLSGLDMFRLDSYDLILLDISMPDMDGYAVVHEIREIERTHRRRPTPVVAFSAHVTAEHEKRALAEGFSGYLRKPVRRQEFLLALAQYGVTTPTADSAPSASSDVSDEARKLLPSYIRSLREQIRAFHEFLAEGRFDRIELIGHNMKSTAISFGLHALSPLGAQIEQAAIKRDAPALKHLVGEVERGVEQAVTGLKVA